MLDRKPCFAFLLAILLLLSSGYHQRVSAHADLIQSVPAANGRVDSPPSQIELYFSETVQPGFSSIQVFDSQGVELQIGSVRNDPSIPNMLFIPVRSLPDGIYSVSWRVLSVVDGHVTTGVFPFAVGDVSQEAITAEASETSTNNLLPEIVARWLTYLAAMSLTGGFLFVRQVWRPAVLELQWEPKGSKPWHHLIFGGLLILAVANLYWLLVQAGTVNGRWIAFPWDPEIRQVLFITRFGALWTARFLLLLVLIGLFFQPASNRKHQIEIILSVLLLLTISLGSHAAAQSNPLLPIVGDILHLTAASFWFGGIIYFVASLRWMRQTKKESRSAARLTTILIKRFSNIAIISMAIIVLSGVYASVLQLGSWSALWESNYGRVLLAKLLFFLLIIGLAGVNQLKIFPALNQKAKRGGSPRLLTQFFKVIRHEAVLGTAVLISVGVLTVLPTPNNSIAIPVIHQTISAADLNVSFDVTPGRVGLNQFAVTVKENGRTLTEANQVALNFKPQTSNLPLNQIVLDPQEDGSYGVSGGYLSLPDLWDVEIVVRREGKPDAFLPFRLDLQQTAIGQRTFPWYRLTGGLFVAAAVAYIFALSPMLPNPRQTLAFTYAPATVLVFLGVLALISDPPADILRVGQIFPLNPLAADSDSIAVGQILYSENCVMCHGETGAGDGAVGLTLDPPPADLRVHAASGNHPDGELYLWITEGVPYNPVMPSFEDDLDDEERWHIVNFIRTFAN